MRVLPVFEGFLIIFGLSTVDFAEMFLRVCQLNYLHLCTYAPIHMYTYTHTHIHVYTCTHTHNTHTPIHMFTYIHIWEEGEGSPR